MQVFSGKFQINGFTDAHNQCDRCGRNELKGTYHITTDQGQDFHLGSSCIKSAWQMSQKDFEKCWFQPYKKRLAIAREEYFKVAEVEQDYQIIKAVRASAALKYGIKSQYEL